MHHTPEAALMLKPGATELVDPTPDRTARWCRVNRHHDTREELLAIEADHRARLRRVRWRGMKRWLKTLIRLCRL